MNELPFRGGERSIRCCATCKWRSDDFDSVCVNDASDHLADFVYADQCCPEWQPSEGGEENDDP